MVVAVQEIKMKYIDRNRKFGNEDIDCFSGIANNYYLEVTISFGYS